MAVARCIQLGVAEFEQKKASGYGSVGKAIAIKPGGSRRFESSHRQIFIILNIYQLFSKDENKQKIGLFFLKKRLSRLRRSDRRIVLRSLSSRRVVVASSSDRNVFGLCVTLTTNCFRHEKKS